MQSFGGRIRGRGRLKIRPIGILVVVVVGRSYPDKRRLKGEFSDRRNATFRKFRNWDN